MTTTTCQERIGPVSLCSLAVVPGHDRCPLHQPHIDDYPEGPAQPDQCYECGRYAEPGETFNLATVDADPGDPEVGPQPDIIEVGLCDACYAPPEPHYVDAATRTGMYDHD